MQLTQSRYQLGPLTLNVAETGADGSTLLMFHGVTQRWQTFVPLIPTLGLRHRLLLTDARGHGESERGHGYRVVDYIDDACALIQQLDTPVAVYGHSLGSMVAAGVAAALGDRISAAIMEDPPLHTMGERIGETHLLNFFRAVAPFAGTDRDPGVVARELAEIEILNPVSNETLRLGEMRTPIQLRFSAACLHRLDPAVLEPIVAGRWLDGFDVDDVFQSIRCPSLLLQADVSAGGMLTEEDARHVASLNDRLVRIPFPGIGHTIHTAATQPLLNSVTAFLETLGS